MALLASDRTFDSDLHTIARFSGCETITIFMGHLIAGALQTHRGPAPFSLPKTHEQWERSSAEVLR